MSLFNPCNFIKNVTITAYLNLRSLSLAFFSIWSFLLRFRCGVNGSSTLIYWRERSSLTAATIYSEVNLSTGWILAISIYCLLLVSRYGMSA